MGTSQREQWQSTICAVLGEETRFPGTDLTRRASDLELELVATAIEESYDGGFMKLTMKRIRSYSSLTPLAALAATYDSRVFPKDMKFSQRSKLLNDAMRVAARYMPSSATHFPVVEPLPTPEQRAAFKRGTDTYIICRGFGMGITDPTLLQRAVDMNCTNHEAVLSVLRENPTATANQIDHILSGGTRSLSSGAL